MNDKQIEQVSLVVLAAGMGARFGGLKQLFPVGYKKQTILEYTLDDAEALGIKRVVFIIRHAMEKEFREIVLETIIRRPFEIRLAFQDDYPLPEGRVRHSERVKPLGTGQALLTGLKAMKTTSAVVVNADDYYGANALKAAAEAASWGRNAIVAYALKDTLSMRGPVSRGVLKLSPKDTLQGIEECRGLTVQNAPEGAYASMNLLALGPSSLKAVEENWLKFCEEGGAESLEKECLLPDALMRMVHAGVEVEVLKTQDRWLGLTHREDLQELDLRIGRVSMPPFTEDKPRA